MTEPTGKQIINESAVYRDCTCPACVDACKHLPGWFMPGEIEKAAELLGMKLEEFKREYLIVEYWIGGASVWAPRKDDQPKGPVRAAFEEAFKPGRCVFLDAHDRCRIHAAKPFECKLVMACEPHEAFRDGIQQAWAAIGDPLKEEMP